MPKDAGLSESCSLIVVKIPNGVLFLKFFHGNVSQVFSFLFSSVLPLLCPQGLEFF